MPETTAAIEETVAQTITVVEPEKRFIDETIDKDGNTLPVDEFCKIIESTEDENGIITTKRMIIGMDEDEIITTRIKNLKLKVALGKATASERQDLQLLIG